MFEVLNDWMFECLCPPVAGLRQNLFKIYLGLVHEWVASVGYINANLVKILSF
jgi:hypothetical protein